MEKITDRTDRVLKKPYTDGLITAFYMALSGLVICLAATIPTLWMKHGTPLLIVGIVAGGLGGLFVLVGLVTLVLRQLKYSKMNEFWASDRPLMRWQYTPAEWQAMREEQWLDSVGDWKVQAGCLTVLFSLAGMLTGVMIGAEHGLLPALADGALGGGLGILAGGVLGAIVAAINFHIARRSLQDTIPGQVAFGIEEILFCDEYFKGNGSTRYVQSVQIRRLSGCELVISIFNPRIRAESEQEWVIPVPDYLEETVAEFASRIVAPRPEE